MVFDHRAFTRVTRRAWHILLHPFDDDRRGHAATCAHRDEGELAVGSLELVERGLACSRLQVPEIHDYGALLPYLAPWKEIGHLGAIRAEILFTQGQQHEAFEQTIQVVRFGRRIQDGRGSIIHYLVGTAIKRIGLERLQRIHAGKTGAVY